MTQFLAAGHVLLRKAKESDLDAAWHNIWQDEALAETMLWQPTASREEATERMRRTMAYQAEHDAFFVCLAETNEVIGFAGIRENEPGEYEDSGICIARRFQRMGYGKEVLRALLKLVFVIYEGRRFTYSCFRDNTASRRLCESAGFVYAYTRTIIREWDKKEILSDFYTMTASRWHEIPSLPSLYRLSERIFVYPYEERRDRPCLAYIQGDRYSIAVDAGHSRAHIDEFYAALKNAFLPLPAVTVLTHWHWDHTFAIHAANGLTAANADTARHLADFRREIEEYGVSRFLDLDECIRQEYADGQPVIITLPDIVFENELWLDAGSCPVHLFRTRSPHTDDCTLIHVPDERVLFIGDAAGGVFPTWYIDPALSAELAETIAATDTDLCVSSHWEPETKQELLRELQEDTEAGSD